MDPRSLSKLNVQTNRKAKLKAINSAVCPSIRKLLRTYAVFMNKATHFYSL